MSAFSNKSANVLAEFGSHKVRNGMVIFTLGHSEDVINILSKAKDKGTNFQVNIIESTPKSQGRKTAVKLAKKDIKVNYFADSAMRLAIKNSDIVLLGADAVTQRGVVYADIGSEAVSELAAKYDIPVYFCISIGKKHKEIVQRYEKSKSLESARELWNIKSKRINILNYKYEKVNPRLITGMISDAGILKVPHFISELRE
ncbi:hypothetical protein JXB27_03985 [Candidatus Woesearchaeota archaeon]|nr:hypothetical protein [Candidatus Woesearchaeota archaeon]